MTTFDGHPVRTPHIIYKSELPKTIRIDGKVVSDKDDETGVIIYTSAAPTIIEVVDPVNKRRPLLFVSKIAEFTHYITIDKVVENCTGYHVINMEVEATDTLPGSCLSAITLDIRE